jgi:HPr kinase/phosphorylase
MKKTGAHAQMAQTGEHGDRQLHHCSVVEIDGTGVLVEGRSGSGKTAMAFGLVEAAQRDGRPAIFVADDQAMLACRAGVLWALAIAPIAGKAELRGFGIIAVDHTPQSRIGLVASLVEDELVERMPPPRTRVLLGVEVPMLELPRRHESQCVRIVLAWLGGARTVCE